MNSIDDFLGCNTFAVVGASRDRAKYGNKVLRAYLQSGRKVYPVNPAANEIEGQRCYASLAALPEVVDAISIVTPPDITITIVKTALQLGIQHFWMQPGAESDEAILAADPTNGKTEETDPPAVEINLIHGGPCILVQLGYREQSGK